MPKAYTEQERALIKAKLKEHARACLKQYGVRKTSVDELVRRASIPKGTFYLFYTSKELLLFEVINEMHDDIQQELFKQLQQFDGQLTGEQFTQLMFSLFKKVDESYLLPLIVNGELEQLMIKLPQELVSEHHSFDDQMVSSMLKLLPYQLPVTLTIEQISAAYRAVFLTMLHKREIGEDVYDDVLKMLLTGITGQLFAPAKG